MIGGRLFDQAALNPFRFTEPTDKRTGDSYIYVVAISTGIVKVGYSAFPQRRIPIYLVDAPKYGAEVTAAWISAPHANARTSERILIGHCDDVATSRIGEEYFTGLSFTNVVSLAEHIASGCDNVPDTGELYPLEAVAEMTGLSLAEVRDGCRAGQIPHIGLGQTASMYRMSGGQIRKFLASQRLLGRDLPAHPAALGAVLCKSAVVPSPTP